MYPNDPEHASVSAAARRLPPLTGLDESGMQHHMRLMREKTPRLSLHGCLALHADPLTWLWLTALLETEGSPHVMLLRVPLLGWLYMIYAWLETDCIG